MPGGFAPRFALEAGFLILVGVGAGYADLRPAVIVALLAGGWVLVSLIELAVWRSQGRAVAAAQARDEPEYVPESEPEPVIDDAPMHSVENVDYPLRPDVDDAPSEEVEAYTRVLGAAREDDLSA